MGNLLCSFDPKNKNTLFIYAKNQAELKNVISNIAGDCSGLFMFDKTCWIDGHPTYKRTGHPASNNDFVFVWIRQ